MRAWPRNRDLTPEDYDLLLKLDESTPKKTASEEQAGQLVPQRVSDGEGPYSSLNAFYIDLCRSIEIRVVCRDPYKDCVERSDRGHASRGDRLLTVY